MAISRVSGNDANALGASGTVTANYTLGSTTTGNLLIAAVFGVGNTGSNTIAGWSKIDIGINGGVSDVTLFYKIAAGETSVTATAAGGGGMQLHIYEYSGAANPVVMDTSNTAGNGTSTATSQVTGTITTTNSGDLVFVVAGQASTNGGSTAWVTSTLLQANTQNKLMSGQYLPGTILTGFQDTASWSTLRTASAIIAAFKPPVSGAVTFITSKPPWRP